MEPAVGEVTHLLKELAGGNQAALSQLTPLVYAKLRTTARSLMRGERTGHALQATALVNEMYVRVLQQEKLDWRSRRHFLPSPPRRCGRFSSTMPARGSPPNAAAARRTCRSTTRSSAPSSSP